MKWTRGKLIGRGSSAAVSLAKSLSSGEIFAVKSIDYSRSNSLRKEQEIHSSLKCDRIIEYKGCDVTLEDGKLLYNIFLEYASCGTLVDVIHAKGGGGLSDPLVRRYTREILQGLQYLHCQGMVHCDLKCANILVTSEGAKLGDFGFCKRIHDVAAFYSSVAHIGGTPLYMAPEVACGEQQSYPADVWALGCTVFEMVTGMSPWPNINQDPLSALFHIGFSGALPQIPEFLPDQAKDFLSKCLKRDPKERRSVAELLRHPFIIDDGPKYGPISNTPTSILDHDFWETLTESHSAQYDVTQEISTKFPIERLRELMVDSICDGLPNWVGDEDWITVRSNKSRDEVESNPSGLVLSSAQNMQPNMISRNFMFNAGLYSTNEQNLPLVNVELSHCCRNTICSVPSNNFIKCDYTCNCITLVYQNFEGFSLEQSFANLRIICIIQITFFRTNCILTKVLRNMI